MPTALFQTWAWMKVIPEVVSTMATGGRQTFTSGQKNRSIKHPDHIKPQPNITHESKWKLYTIISFDLSFWIVCTCMLEYDAYLCWSTTFVTEDLDCKAMAGETLESQKPWEKRIFHSVGIERFCFGGHEISIHESFDSYGALIWPGVRAKTKQTYMTEVTERQVWCFLMWWELVIMCV